MIPNTPIERAIVELNGINTHFVIRKKETELNPKSKKALNWINIEKA